MSEISRESRACDGEPPSDLSAVDPLDAVAPPDRQLRLVVRKMRGGAM
jgi:hypothetical protein